MATSSFSKNFLLDSDKSINSFMKILELSENKESLNIKYLKYLSERETQGAEQVKKMLCKDT